MSEPFEELVRQYHQLTLRLVQRYYGGTLKDRAEDLAQEIWAKLWERFKKNENNIVNFKSYLYRTAQTTLWDAVRSLEKERGVALDESHEIPGDEVGEKSRLERIELQRMIALLSEEEAQMTRAYIRGFNNEEIAALLGCSEGRARNLISRIKKKLALMGGGS